MDRPTGSTRALAPLVLAIGIASAAGCGGGASTVRATGNDPTTQQVQAIGSSCGLDARTMSVTRMIPMPGTRVSLLLPRSEEILLLRGVSAAVHACGLSVFVVAAPIGPEGPTFLDGAIQG